MNDSPTKKTAGRQQISAKGSRQPSLPASGQAGVGLG